MANVNHFDSDHFEAALAQPGVVLVDFFATWCMPCKMVAPVIEKVAESYAGKVTVGKVDIDEEPDLAAAYNVQHPAVRGRQAGFHPGGGAAFRDVCDRAGQAGLNSLKDDIDNRGAGCCISSRRLCAIFD
mgnify:CR=1 FL=1